MTRWTQALAVLIIVSIPGQIAFGEGKDRKALFGELHIHTLWSFDAYLFNTRATPDDACEFARGKPLKHPLGETYQLSRPLDFMAVTDHAFYLGVMAKMGDKTHPLSKHPLAAKINSPETVALGNSPTSCFFTKISRISSTKRCPMRRR